MATYSYLTALEAAVLAERPGARGSGIRGLRVADAGRWCTVTDAGYARVPVHGWEGPRKHQEQFKVLDRMERLTEDCDPGTYELHFADGTSAYIGRKDLLCVERPIMPVHYGESTTACGELGKYDTVTTHPSAVSCGPCVQVINASV